MSPAGTPLIQTLVSGFFLYCYVQKYYYILIGNIFLRAMAMSDKTTTLDGFGDEMSAEQAEALISAAIDEELAGKEGGVADDSGQDDDSSHDDGQGDDQGDEPEKTDPEPDDSQGDQDPTKNQVTPPQSSPPSVDQATTSALLAQIAELNQQLASLRASKEQDTQKADPPPAPEDPAIPSAEKLIEMFGDFSAESMAAAVHKLTQDGIKNGVAREVERLVSPLIEQQRARDVASHVSRIEAAHPDAKDISASGALAAWVASRPDYLRGAYESVLSSGTTEQVIALFNEYKGSLPQSPEKAKDTKTSSQVIEKAKAIASSAKKPVPETLSGVSGQGQQSREIDYSNMPPEELVDVLSQMSPEQLKKYIDKY